MRFFEPLLVLLSIVLFLAVVLISALLTLLLPMMGLAVGLVLLFTGHWWGAWAALRSVPSGFESSFDALGLAARMVTHPFGRDHFVIEGNQPLADLQRLCHGLTPPETAKVDVLVLTDEPTFGIAEVQTRVGVRRVLFAGTPLLFQLEVDELRAVLAHELGHLVLGHTAWSSVLGRWTRLMDEVAAGQRSWHPMVLGLRFCSWMFRTVRAGWSKRQELAADAYSAELCGAEAAISALRKVHDGAGLFYLVSAAVVRRARSIGVGPESLAEASYRILQGMSPKERHAFGRSLRPDPFDVGGRTHPPFHERHAALLRAPRGGVRDRRPALSLLPEVVLAERRLTGHRLKGLRLIPAREWLEESRPEVTQRRQAEVMASLTGYQEFELGE